MKDKTFKQLGTPTVDAEELAEMEEIDLEKLQELAMAARGADEAELRTDAVQDSQPSEPPPLDALLVGQKIQVRWRYIISTPSQALAARIHTCAVRERWRALPMALAVTRQRERALFFLPTQFASCGRQTLTATSLKCLHGQYFTPQSGIRTCRTRGDGRHASLSALRSVTSRWPNLSRL
eukprot:1573151-Pleurochrysis_carterae.AAC.1